ncbi:bifunctional homocysteine S-methyltransferase/methylenetetrahydrofolate reductase [[Clostridium] fimetarium]|uniref:Homocysteine S-methyltransferase n=1 Tax=[Clostridium] fimetarium TaxID=99656 RepID=A0A1I0QYH1_9FIRM|nr:bifunctional homocysteine S-methyltransferase/methylenetetrahydrofolate reductase [[Clostridium] fimetarium]SEW32630.1 homocysteine S-methyltransferase [[Clostridium] fimetarium]
MLNIREYLKNNRLIMDGAMGTYYSDLEGDESAFSEFGNINRPEIIEKIHSDYINAGAKLIRTNSFATSIEALGVTVFEQKRIIEASCEIAKRAAKDKAYVAGDIGPIKENAESTESEILDEYIRMCDIFLAADVDVILFETFSDMIYIKQLVKYIRSKKDVFIMTNFCLNKNGFTRNGLSATKILSELAQIDEIDACGFNCGIGSGHMSNIMKKLKYPSNKYIACIPNAGYPEQMQNRMIFMDNVDYFSNNMKAIADLGIDIVGGCCGTRPTYIKKLAEKIDLKPVKKVSFLGSDIAEVHKELRKNVFYSKFETGKKVIAVELDPPFDADYEKLVEYAHTLKKQGVDIITMADSPMGRSRVDSILMSVKLANETGINVMPHICCRDKNMIAIRSTLLGAYINDIRDLLLVTGDPVPSESRRLTTGVFDYNSIQLMNFVKEMNQEHFADEPFYYGGALNPTMGKIDNIIDRIQKKIDAGCKYFLTQPVYSDDAIERLAEIKRRVDTKILCGIMPLVSYRNANFMKNEFIGIDIPDNIVARYRPEMSKEEGEETGAKIARELMEKLNPIVDGYYFMLPFNRVSLIGKILG